jgi:hypothetical protein
MDQRAPYIFPGSIIATNYVFVSERVVMIWILVAHDLLRYTDTHLFDVLSHMLYYCI